MIHYITYTKDVIGNNYLAIKVGDEILTPFLNEMKEHLGSEEEYEDFIQNKINRDRGENHITVMNVADYNKLAKKHGFDKFVSSLDAIFKFPIDDLEFKGLGSGSRKGNTTYFVVCKSEKLEAVRKRYELSEHDFHVTIGFKHKDVFGIRKNEVIKAKSKFVKVLATQFMEKENFNFVRHIDNYDGDSELEIIPVSINDTYLKIVVGDTILSIGLIEDKLKVVTNYEDKEGVERMPLTEIINFLKNNL